MNAPGTYREVTDAQLLELLATEGDRLTRAAVDEIVARGGRMVEPLTRILLTKDAWDEEEGTEFWRPVHAAYILAAIGGEKALPGLLAAITESLDTGCDWVTDEIPSMFAAIGPVAITPLLERVRDAEDDDLMELESLYSALGAIAVRHPDRRDELLDLLGDTVRDSNQSWARRFAAGATLMTFTRPDDRKPLLTVAREAEKMELPVFTTDDVEAMYSGKFKLTPAPPLAWLQFYSPEQIEKRQEVFSDELPDAEDEVDDDDLIREMDETPVVQEEGMPVVNPAAPGRNDPCPCGSGKKYKKCCEP